MSSSAKEVAQSILRNMKHHCQSSWTLLEADEREFLHLQLNAYKQSKSQLEKYEFRHISDIEILEVTTSPNTVIARTFIRSMISSENSIVSEYYQVRPRLGRVTKNLIFGILGFRFIAAPRTFFTMLKTKHYHGFETELADGNIYNY